MKLILLLLRASWRVVLLAGAVGGLSGAASVAIVILIYHTLRHQPPAPLVLAGLFAGLCLVVLATQIVSQMLLSRLMQTSIERLQIGLCRRILESPLRHLEDIGAHRMLATLTGDVSVVSQALNGVPVLGVNVVILVCGAVYLGWLSLPLLLGAAVFCILAMASYWYAAGFARRYIQQARDAQNDLMKHIRDLIEGVKELKMHNARRGVFVDDVLVPAERLARRSQFVGDCLNNAAIAWGRLTFFIAIAMLLFAWPRLHDIDAAALMGYVLTILYLMSPLEQIMGWLPFVGWAAVSVSQIEQLGLMLQEEQAEPAGLAVVDNWRQIDFSGVTHAYRREGQAHGFVLGPIDLKIGCGEIVFIVGGNGSGKTTLAKLITGLYAPESGGVCLDGQPVHDGNREGYRQLFSVVFDDAIVFDALWGLDAADLDQQAREYIRQLELDHVVTVNDGEFSTTRLSRGQRKRLALVTAYLENRPIYVFDEWAADQDPAFRQIFYHRLLPELKQRGKTVIAVTHDDRYFDCADRIVKLEEGKVVEAKKEDRPPLPHTNGDRPALLKKVLKGKGGHSPFVPTGKE